MSESLLPKSTIFGPLRFPDAQQEIPNNWPSSSRSCTNCTCLLCDDVFILPLEEKMMLTHFLTSHKLVIAEVHLIADLKEYVSTWKNDFAGQDLAEFCSTMIADATQDGELLKDQRFYLLSDVLPKDYELRNRLREQKLHLALTQYQIERSEDYKKGCLFCRDDIHGTCIDFLKHLFEKHNLFLGNPHKLVYIDEMVNMINEKIERFECLFCDKTFKDRLILKEHMRKKGHKSINPKNKQFDRFYLSNYINNTKESNTEISDCPTTENDSDDSEWQEVNLTNEPSITCLFCKYSDAQYDNFLAHMKDLHSFDFKSIVEDLDFYEKIKLVNYVRRQTYLMKCIGCDKVLADQDELCRHMKEQKHCSVEDKTKWDQMIYFFSTYENDNLLWYLDNDSQDWYAPNGQEVIQEMFREDLERANEILRNLNVNDL